MLEPSQRAWVIGVLCGLTFAAVLAAVFVPVIWLVVFPLVFLTAAMLDPG